MESVALQELPEPVAGPGEVKIAVEYAGICGTDMHVVRDEYPNEPPFVLGHEFCGTITAIGEGVEGFRAEDRVTASPTLRSCGRCRFCASGQYNLCKHRRILGFNENGAFASHCVVSAAHVYHLPEEVNFRAGALTEPLTPGVRAVIENTRISAGDVVLVCGPGTVGLMTLQVAKAQGAKAVMLGVGSDEERLSLAKDLGADVALNVEKEDPREVMNDLTGGYGVEAAFECSGAQDAALLCVELVRRGGSYTQVGLFGRPVTLPLDDLVLKEIRLKGSYSHHRSTWERALTLLSEGKVKTEPMISAELPLTQWEEGFRMMEAGEGLKVLLKPV
jgi:L-iditol 2-dehydrogenase